MRLVQRGIANNFGLVGKNIRRYLTTTALTATGLMAIATPALAEGSWSNFEVLSGEQTVTTPDVNTTNIQVHTMDATVRGDANIAATDTVNLNQVSDKSKYVVFDIKSDPTKIMGKLNANGRVYIFDQNGVIFGEGAQINVGGIVASTGHISQANLDAENIKIEDVGTQGEVVNNGSITVSEGGLAALVAPSVRNNGIINAKAGTVALASGSKVTLDLYGDGLVSVAADGELADAIIENKGTINAAGGTVALTVAAAKNAVDSVVNMDGIIDVSSSTGKGGKVKIDGGNKGAVKVTGKIDATGQGGGDISISGENVLVTSSSVLDTSALQNGNGGNIKIWGNRNSFFFGNAYARGGSVSGDGGFVEVSAADSVGYAGLVDTTAANGETGRFLIDPKNVVLGTVNPAVMVANIGLDILLGGNLGTLVVDQKALANTLHTTDVDLWATETISTAEKINLSEYNYSKSTTTMNPFPSGCGAICKAIWAINPANYTTVVTNYNGITGKDLTLAAPTVNINHDITLGNGKLLVQDLAAGTSPLGLGLLPAPEDIIVEELNLGGRVYKRANLVDASFSTLADDAQLFTTANNINVLSNSALIQQGVHFADDAGGATVTVGDGVYAENVSINKGLKLISLNGRAATKIEGISGASAEATVQIENDANNVQVGDIGKGFTIVGFDNGNPASENAAVYLRGNHSNIDLIGNDIVANGDLALLSLYAGVMSDITIDNNIFSGKTFNGAAPATGDQFSVPNVARPLVFFGNTPTKSDIKFTNNQVTGTAGAGSAGNLLVNIDSTGATVTGNVFNGTTGGTQGSLRVRGTNTLVSGNTFYAAGLPDAGYHVYITPSAYAGSLGQDDILDIWNSNTFVGRATVTDSDVFAGFDFIGLTIQGAVDASTATGADIYVNGGATYNESVLVNKSAYLHGANAGKAGYDLTRGPESIVDPNSPGFKIVADNVTLDGFLITGATGSDGYGVWVDVGADNAVIKNNIINSVTQNGVFADTALNTEVSANQIDNTGSHGILIKGGKDARILGNYIGTNGADFSIVGDAIQINGSNGAWVKYNRATNTTSTADNIGSGVHSISSNGVKIIENVTWDTDWDGVRVNMGNNVLVKENDIDDAKRTGVYLGQTTNSSAVKNDIDKVGNYGVNLDRGSNVTARGNYIDDTGISGIQAYNNVKSTIKNNKIGQSGVAGNIKGNGIIVKGGSNTTVDKNKIGYTVLDGIHVLGTNGAQVTKNDLDVIGEEGIQLLNAVGILQVSENYVDTTKKHGIRITNSDKVKVLTNYVGLSGGAKNINGDGIRIEESDDVLAQYNQVTNTDSPSGDQGNGVQSILSNRTQILDNILWNTAWDGVRVERGTGVNVERNDIDDVTRTGVFAMYTANTLIKDNYIDDAGRRGVYVYSGKDITIDNNNIDYVLGSDSSLNDGIRAEAIDGILIQYNKIGTDGGDNTIGRNGIYAVNNEDVTIYDNVVQNAVERGIYAKNTTNPMLIQLNKVKNVGNDGIRVEGFDTVLIKTNEVTDAGGDGIDVHDGIQVEIDDNDVVNSGHDGIHVKNIMGPTIISSIASLDNVMAEIGSAFIRITGNTVDSSNDDGVDVDDSQAYTYVYDNTISNSGVGDNVESNADITGGDGISIENVGQPYYFGDVVREGDIGNGEYNIVVAENGVTNSQDDGIEVVGTNLVVRASLSESSYEGEDYHYVGTTGRVLIQENSVVDSGWGEPSDGFGDGEGYGADGIHVRNVYPYNYYSSYASEAGASESGFYGYAVDVLGNDVTDSGDDGIEVIYSESTLIDDNTVKNSGFGSEGSEEPTIQAFKDYYESDYGADGIHVRNVGYYYEGGYSEDDNYDGESSENTLPGYGYEPYSVVIRRNDVDNSQDNGIQVHNDMWFPTAPVLVEINENVSNSGNQALYISGPTHTNVIVRGNAFSNFDTGGQFESGLIDLSQAGNSWTNGNYGLRFSPFNFGGEAPSWANLNLVDDDGDGSTPYPTTPTNFGGTIGEQTFTGFTEDGKFYVYLDDGAFQNEGTPIWINGLNSTYDTIQPSLTAGLLSEEDYNYLEARFRHFPDAGASSTDIFWFGYFIPDDLPTINQSLIFNRFNAFNGDATGLNVQIVSLPSLGGAPGVNPAALNQIGPFAGNNATDPSALNQIETAAGGDTGQSNATQLNNLAPASGGESQSCWGNAVAAAGNGQVVNVAYTGGAAANLNMAATCGTGF